MNKVTLEKKERLLKTLAIFGLLGIIITLAWVSVQIVRVFPTAIESLASLADSVYNHEVVPGATEISLLPVATSTVSGEKLALTWDNVPETGSYTLSYVCAEGLVVEIQTADTNFQSTSCNTAYTLGLVDKASLTISSTKHSEVTFTYTISYFKTNSLIPSATFVNNTLITNPRLAIIPGEVSFPEAVISTSTATSTSIIPTPTKPTVPTTAKPNLPAPAPTYEYTYTIPVSDPNGFTDLKVTYLGIGEFRNNKTFVNTGKLEKGEAGAIQFTVQNIGTKTSSTWNFKANLPGDASYESKDQIALSPNERATITISFPKVDETKTQTFKIEVEGGNDTNSRNDSFTWSTKVSN